MSTGVQILVGAFPDEASADAAYKQLKRRENDAWLQDAAIVVHQGDKVKFKESHDMGFGKGAAAGGVLGALTGLLFPPAILIFTVGGALIGGTTAKLHDANLPDSTFRELGAKLAEGSAAIIAVVNESLAAQATDALKRMGATVTVEGLDAETAARLQAGASSGPDASSATPPAPSGS
jgi:uncharacterized membrane protein